MRVWPYILMLLTELTTAKAVAGPESPATTVETTASVPPTPASGIRDRPEYWMVGEGAAERWVCRPQDRAASAGR